VDAEADPWQDSECEGIGWVAQSGNGEPARDESGSLTTSAAQPSMKAMMVAEDLEVIEAVSVC
jgi:hypothetical protein